MASAYPYTWTRSDGSTGRAWRARWVGADGRPQSKRGFDRKRDAESYASDREAEARHGVALGQVAPSGRTTVEAWGKTWLAGLEVRPQTRTAYEYGVKRINASLGGRSLVSLRPSELKAWRRGLGDRLAPATVDATVSVLAMMLRAAVQDGLLERSPLAPQRGGVSSSRVVDPDELLTLEQVHAWGLAMPRRGRRGQAGADVPGPCAEMPLVAATTGLRQGELLGLQVADVDFLRRSVRVWQQLVSPAGKGQPEYGPPKTAAGVRSVPLPQITADALARHLERYPPVEGEPIFRPPRSMRWSRSNFGEVWQAAKKTAGLPGWAHWHSLRDVYASSLIRAGVDLRTVMTLLGHTSSEETLRTYARLWPDAQDVARKALEQMWSSESTRHGRATEGVATL